MALLFDRADEYQEFFFFFAPNYLWILFHRQTKVLGCPSLLPEAALSSNWCPMFPCSVTLGQLPRFCMSLDVSGRQDRHLSLADHWDACLVEKHDWYVLIVVQSLGHVKLFCSTVDYSQPGSSVRGISQARILEWVSISFSRGSSWLRDGTHVSCMSRRILYHWAMWETQIFA